MHISSHALRSIHSFSPLLKGDQFHVYLTAQSQNAVPKIFAFSNIPNLPKQELRLPLVMLSLLLLLLYQ